MRARKGGPASAADGGRELGSGRPWRPEEEGDFSTVYLARLSGGSKSELAAVKVHRSCSERLRRAFRQELDALLRVHQPHIVRLLAFCDQHNEGLLVLEFAPNGNLHDNLYGDDGKLKLISTPWARQCWCMQRRLNRSSPCGVAAANGRKPCDGK